MSRMKMKGLLSRKRNKEDKDGTTSANADLDEEMEKVFAMSENDKFDFSTFVSEDLEQKSPSRFGENEFSNSHRKKTYPHIHLPIKGLRSHSHSSRRPGALNNNYNNTDFTKTYITEEKSKSDDESIVAEISRKQSIFYDDSFKEPAISERAGAAIIRDSSPDRRVQFSIGTNEPNNIPLRSHEKNAVQSHTNLVDHKVKRKHSHHHKKRKPMVNGDSNRNRKISSSNDQEDGSYQLILQLEEPLEEFVQDDLTSHRFGCSRDNRRFSTRSNVSVLLNKRGTEGSIVSSLPIKIPRKSFDHSPHEVFVQLDELVSIGDELEWKETARWIKYEEDVVEGADRWGKPHVASLSFHSLLNLRRCLETGVVMLDLEEKELPGIAYRVVEQMAVSQLIKEEEKPTVIRALLLRHRHVNEHERFRFIRRNTASYSSLQNLHEDQKCKNKPSVCSVDFPLSVSRPSNSTIDGLRSNDIRLDMKEEIYMSSNEDLDRKFQKEKERILKRIPTGAEAIAVLVGTVNFVQEPAIAFIRLAQGILLPAVTEVTIPVRFMFILLGPPKADVDYREIGRSISTLMSNSDFNKKAYKATDRRDLLRAINEFLDYSIVLPPGNWEKDALLSLRELRAKNEAIRKRRIQREIEASSVTKALLPFDDEKKDEDPFGDPLRRRKKCFGGMVTDIKRRVPHYKSDFTDGLNLQCFSAAVFMYFASLSTTITFGGLFANKTKNKIGISETLISTSICGIVFAFLAGQPLLIIGTTGPLLLFDESLFKFCFQNDIEYLTMRLYIGFWLFIIALLVASIEGSVFIKVFTRFTEEIFASLISLIYIVESITNMISVFQKHPILKMSEYCTLHSCTSFNSTSNSSSNAVSQNQPNTALFCMILSLGTFFLAFYLRHFRNSKFLGRSVRRALGDFGVPISIIVMGALAAVSPDTYTDRLTVPEGLSPSEPEGRGWIISPLGLKNNFPIWAMFAAIVPAILIYILVFMETHISELIIGKKERKLKKGSGFHLDIVLVCLSNVGCGMIGAPWMCAATVRSVAHVSANTVMSTTHAPGEKPHIIKVQEQRVSALLVSTLVGVSVLMAPVLRVLPMAVLFGVFLYMGISSIDGIQFFERLKLFLMPVKHHPQTAYVRKVSTIKMYLFTLIQLLCLSVLWIIKSSSLSLLFPFFLVLMVPLRAQLAHFFTVSELRALDSDEPDASDKEDDEPDFYVESLLPG